MSMDGYLDSGDHRPLRLSNAADLARVDEERAGCDAILVGARTIRNDDPRLLVRSPALRAARTRTGRSPSPMKVTVTARGALIGTSRFFSTGPADTLVYCSRSALEPTRMRLAAVATVATVGGGEPLTMLRVAEDLATRGVRRLMVEGGGSVLTQFLGAGLADELQLAVAPVFVGDSRAHRFVGDGPFPWTVRNRAELMETRSIGDVALLRYVLSDRGRTRIEHPVPLASWVPPRSGHLVRRAR
jgi:5-amino-6-(5-phosphoribosylamino)uracil reductase